jgi:lysophospholipase L1-like esterase
VPRGSRSLARFFLPFFALACFVLPLEAALRVFPQAIPIALLSEFHPVIRSRIAARRRLQRVEDTVLLPRDDGGPADRMWLYKGGAEITREFDEPGIVPTVRMDDMGFCNPIPGAYDVAKIDVAALGDSLTWCTSVAPGDAWPAMLAEASGLVIYNFAIPGRGLYEHLQILKRFALPKQPAIVILAVYEGNDLRDAVRFFEEKDSPAPFPGSQRCPFRPVALCSVHEALMDTLPARHSWVYNLLLVSAWRVAYLLQKSDIDFRYAVDFPDGVSARFNVGNADRDEVSFAAELREKRVRPELFDDALAAFVGLAKEHHFVPIVAYIPSAHSAYAAMARFDDPSIAEIMRAYSDTLRDYFALQAETLGYRFLDLTPALEEAARTLPSERPLYFRSNVHLTPAGHAVVARELAALLSGVGDSAQRGKVRQ